MLAFFFFNDTATTEIYTLSLHDALPISRASALPHGAAFAARPPRADPDRGRRKPPRSKEHTSELQSPCNLVCRLLLEKKKKTEYDNDYALSVDTIIICLRILHSAHATAY